MTTPNAIFLNKPVEEVAYGQGAYDDFGLNTGSPLEAAKFEAELYQKYESVHEAKVVDIAGATGNLAIRHLAVAA